MRTELLAGVVVLVVASSAPVTAQLYRWTDEEGVVHYTADRTAVPPAYQERIRDLAPPRPGPAPLPGDAREGAVIPRQPGAPIVVAASLNGVPLALVVDTGADRTVIAPGALARTGLDLAGVSTVQIVGVTGSVTATQVVVQRLDVAGASLGPLTVIVHDLGMPGVDGLVGRDVLDAFTLTVDPGGERATLVPR